MHAVTSPKLSIVTKVLVQTASARRHTVDAGGCRSRPILARDRARMRDRASPLQEWATLVARRPRPRPRPLQAEVMRAAWLFRGRKPELNSLQKSCAQRGCSADATPSSTHSVCRPRRRSACPRFAFACAELLLTRSFERLGRQLGSRRVEPSRANQRARRLRSALVAKEVE